MVCNYFQAPIVGIPLEAGEGAVWRLWRKLLRLPRRAYETRQPVHSGSTLGLGPHSSEMTTLMEAGGSFPRASLSI